MRQTFSLRSWLGVVLVASMGAACTSQPSPGPSRGGASQDQLEVPAEVKIEKIDEGSGKKTQAGDRVVFHYRAVSVPSGKTVGSSWEKGSPIQITLGQKEVVPGLEVSLYQRAVGARFNVIVPPSQGYRVFAPNVAGDLSEQTLKFEVFVVAIRDENEVI